MNIQPVKTDIIQPPSKTKARAVAETSGPAVPVDQSAVGRKEALKEALLREPALRPEMVERARKLAADPDYPSSAVLTKLAEKFVADAKRAR